MRRSPLVLDWPILGIVVALLWFILSTGSSSAIKKQSQSCADELEETKTQLRLRTAELRVAHGQLDSAWKKLKACGVSAGTATEE